MHTFDINLNGFSAGSPSTINSLIPVVVSFKQLVVVAAHYADNDLVPIPPLSEIPVSLPSLDLPSAFLAADVQLCRIVLDHRAIETRQMQLLERVALDGHYRIKPDALAADIDITKHHAVKCVIILPINLYEVCGSDQADLKHFNGKALIQVITAKTSNQALVCAMEVGKCQPPSSAQRSGSLPQR